MSSLAEIKNRTTGENLTLNRVIGKRISGKAKAGIIFLAGMHGNEPSGIFALHKLFQQLDLNDSPVHGDILAISGNLKALSEGKRYLSEDLNRLWLPGILNGIDHVEVENFQIPEYEELKEIHHEIEDFLEQQEGPVYVIDLHTTSGLTKPFVFINASTSNIDFCKKFPVAIVTGIGNYLSGTLLSHINKKGHVSLAFEAGQHKDPGVVDLQLAFSWMSLVVSGIMDREDIEAFDDYEKLLHDSAIGDAHKLFTIIDRYDVSPEEEFKMIPGFTNFQKVDKGQALANNKRGDICSPFSGKLFMPLYQSQGTDGFFIIKDIDHNL